MKIKFDKLKNLTTFGESLTDYLPFFGFLYKKRIGIQIIFGLYRWGYSLIITRKNDLF